jgi:hypothetical protein
MKRKAALCLLTAALAAVSFALPSSVVRAEGNGEQSDSGSASAETVKVWFGANEEENAVLEEIAERFEQETGIAVEVVARRAIFDARPILSYYAQLEERRTSFIFRRRISARSCAPAFWSRSISPRKQRAGLRTSRSRVYAGSASVRRGIQQQYIGAFIQQSADFQRRASKNLGRVLLHRRTADHPDGSGGNSQFGTLLNARNMWFVYPIIRNTAGTITASLRTERITHTTSGSTTRACSAMLKK